MARCALIGNDVIQEMYSIKIYLRTMTILEISLEVFLIPLKNDQGRRDIIYQYNIIKIPCVLFEQ